MALPTNRQAGDVISASDINAIATQVNANETAISGKLPLGGGTMTGNLNMGGKVLSNFRSTQTTDPATRSYVTTQVGTTLPLAGGTMTGNINMNGKTITNAKYPTAVNEVATKQYVDQELANLPLPTTVTATAFKTYNNQSFTSGETLFSNNSGTTVIFNGYIFCTSTNGLVTEVYTSATNISKQESEMGTGAYYYWHAFSLVVPNGASVTVTAMQRDGYTDIAVPYITGTAYKLTI